MMNETWKEIFDSLDDKTKKEVEAQHELLQKARNDVFDGFSRWLAYRPPVPGEPMISIERERAKWEAYIAEKEREESKRKGIKFVRFSSSAPILTDDEQRKVDVALKACKINS